MSDKANDMERMLYSTIGGPRWGEIPPHQQEVFDFLATTNLRSLAGGGGAVVQEATPPQSAGAGVQPVRREPSQPPPQFKAKAEPANPPPQFKAARASPCRRLPALRQSSSQSIACSSSLARTIHSLAVDCWSSRSRRRERGRCVPQARRSTTHQTRLNLRGVSAGASAAAAAGQRRASIQMTAASMAGTLGFGADAMAAVQINTAEGGAGAAPPRTSPCAHTCRGDARLRSAS